MKNMILEGGNVFKDIHSEPIKKEDIKPTLKEYFREFRRIFPGASVHFEGIKTLGSTGKKQVSGDIDLALDENAFKHLEDWDLDKAVVSELAKKFKAKSRTASDKQLFKRAFITLMAEKIEQESKLMSVDTKQAGAGTLFTQFPQYTSKGKTDKYVQCDLNIGNLPWLLFAYYSDSYEGNVKGLHRTQLVLTLFSNKGFTFSHNYGVKNKETNEIVATNPEEAIELLNKLYGFNLDQDILNNYYKLQDYLKEHLDERELHAIWDRYLKILDSTRCDIPLDLQSYWLDSQDRLGLTGKFLPNTSQLSPFKDID